MQSVTSAVVIQNRQIADSPASVSQGRAEVLMFRD